MICFDLGKLIQGLATVYLGIGFLLVIIELLRYQPMPDSLKEWLQTLLLVAVGTITWPWWIRE